MEPEQGYRGAALGLLKRGRVKVGDVIEVDLGSSTAKGTVVPRYQSDDESHIVIKLASGYNVGIGVRKVKRLAKLAVGEMPAFATPPPPKPRKDLPLVSILGTGGTIASRVDYRTGAVHPAVSSEDLYSLIPELSEIANVEPEIVLSVYSENLEPENWTLIAEKVVRDVKRGARGVVITTGTDFMGYTAAALSFALQGVPVPVVVVASQRSSDRPSSDAYLNLLGAVSCSVSAEFAGVFVMMHADTSDERLAIHQGTRVRKNHSSARYAFESIGVDPVAYWSRSGLEVKSSSLRPRGSSTFIPTTKFEKNVALVKAYPSMTPAIIVSLMGAKMKGIVLEGSGLGHLNKRNLETVSRCVKNGAVVCMTTQCIWGRVDMNVYDTGRDLTKAGVVPLGDTLAETALAKLMWALANCGSVAEVKKVMLSNLVGEMTDRTIPES